MALINAAAMVLSVPAPGPGLAGWPAAGSHCSGATVQQRSWRRSGRLAALAHADDELGEAVAIAISRTGEGPNTPRDRDLCC